MIGWKDKAPIYQNQKKYKDPFDLKSRFTTDHWNK